MLAVAPRSQIGFGPYRFNPRTGQLWRGKQEVRMTGKAAAVLRHLVERAEAGADGSAGRGDP